MSETKPETEIDTGNRLKVARTNCRLPHPPPVPQYPHRGLRDRLGLHAAVVLNIRYPCPASQGLVMPVVSGNITPTGIRSTGTNTPR